MEQGLAVAERRAIPVRRTQTRGEADEEIGEDQRIAPVRRRLVQRCPVPSPCKEQHGAAVADEVGEGLVEVGMAADVTGIVQQLVDDDVGQRGTVVAQ